MRNILTFLSIALLSTAVSAQVVQDLPAGWTASWSPWKTPVQDYTPTAESAGTINHIYTGFSANTFGFNGYLWNGSLVLVDSANPSETLYPATVTNGAYKMYNVPFTASWFNEAARKYAAGDTDSAMTLYDTATGIAYICTGTRVDANAHTLTSFSSFVAYKPGGAGWWDDNYLKQPGFGRATGSDQNAGAIGAAELASGEIKHAIGMAFPNAYSRGSSESPKYVYPATAGDGIGSSGLLNDMPMGRRMVLDPSLSDATLIATYGMNAYDLTLAHALQKYGAYSVDSNTTSPAFYFISATSGAQSAALYPTVAAHWPMTLLRDHMWLVNSPAPVPLDNTLQNPVMYLTKTVGTGNGSTTTFTLTDSGIRPPVKPGTFTVTATVGGLTKTAVDDGFGNLSGTGISSGTINYKTGALSITYSAAPDNTTSITAEWKRGI